MNILGLSAFYHDAAACLVSDGRIVAAAQEERFSRIKHDSSFPRGAAAYCLAAGGVGPRQLDAVAFYEKPLTKFVRLMTTHAAVAPRGLRVFLKAAPLWMRQKLWIPYEIERELAALGFARPPKIYFTEHHESHAASAFYPSPFASAAIITMDGVGEWATTSVGIGRNNQVSLLRELRFPHSLGLLYSAFTYFSGFKVNSGEYKLMGLAPYGEPRFVQTIYDHVVDLRADGSFRLNPRYFNYLSGLTMTSDEFERLFEGPPRVAEAPITRRERDLASSIQVVTEEIVMRIARHARSLTGEERVCLAGGVALNCVANGRLQREGVFRDLWIQPASGDAGGALGAALYAWHQILGHERTPQLSDQMEGTYLGPAFSTDEIGAFLDDNRYPFERVDDTAAWARRIADWIAAGKVVGLFFGRMEFGPRALGHRSIVGDARSPEMQSTMNVKIKYRESFRPFAPSVLREDCGSWFDTDLESPYMSLVASVQPGIRRHAGESQQNDDLRKWVSTVRSTLPAITHVDYSARLQTVTRERNPRYYEIIEAFKKATGVGVIINTSFNVRGEPIVCTPEDAYRCFMRTEMDHLVLENCLLDRAAQPRVAADEAWRQEYGLD